MAQAEKNHFSKTVLSLSERTHQSLGHSTVGKAVTKAITGAPSAAYRQLDWTSRDLTYNARSRIKVQGDRRAGIVPRYWTRAAVIAAPKDEVESLRNYSGSKEAIAYFSEGDIHVGMMAVEGALFGDINDDELAISMRLGKGPLEATMGVWLPKDRNFVSVKNVRVVEQSAFVSNLSTDYPGTNLT